MRPWRLQLLLRLAYRLANIATSRQLLAVSWYGLCALQLVQHLSVREVQVRHAHGLRIRKDALTLRWPTILLHVLLDHNHLLRQIVAVSLLHFAP